MDQLLKLLLDRLEFIGKANEEIYDTVCRDLMADAIFDGFIREKPGYVVPEDFGLFSSEANAAVRNALSEYILNATELGRNQGINSFKERLAALQNGNVKSQTEGAYFDDFLGYSKPEAFDDAGHVLPT